MEITIRTTRFPISEGMTDSITDKLDRLNRYLPNITAIHVDLTQQLTHRGEDRSVAQITVRHARGAILRAEESTDGDMQVALQQALDNMYRRIERFKGKRSPKGRASFGASSDEVLAAESAPDVDALTNADEDQVNDDVIRRKTVSLIAMSEDEAIEQMELIGHTFFMFFNAQSGAVNVVYKRHQGGYGVLIAAVG